MNVENGYPAVKDRCCCELSSLDFQLVLYALSVMLSGTCFCALESGSNSAAQKTNKF